jgi:30S ribosomal protein S31
VNPEPLSAPAFSNRLRAHIRSVGVEFMGKGDPRSRRGKIYQGSFGKTRPKDPSKKKKAAAKSAKK